MRDRGFEIADLVGRLPRATLHAAGAAPPGSRSTGRHGARMDERKLR